MLSEEQIKALVEYSQIFAKRVFAVFGDLENFGLNIEGFKNASQPINTGNYRFYVESDKDFLHINHLDHEGEVDYHIRIGFNDYSLGGIALYQSNNNYPLIIIRKNSPTDIISDIDYSKIVKLLDRSFAVVNKENPNLTRSHPELEDLACNCSSYLDQRAREIALATNIDDALPAYRDSEEERQKALRRTVENSATATMSERPPAYSVTNPRGISSQNTTPTDRVSRGTKI